MLVSGLNLNLRCSLWSIYPATPLQLGCWVSWLGFECFAEGRGWGRPTWVGMKQQWVTHRFMPSDSNRQEYLLKSAFHCAGGNGPYCKYRQISLKWFAQPCLPSQLLGREVVMEPCRQCALALGAASPQVGHSGQEAVWAKLALCPSPLIEKLLLTCKNWRRKYLYERNKRKWP